MLGGKKDLRAPVPQSHHLMSIGLDGQAKCPGQTKVSQLDRLAVFTDQQVLWLQVSVEDPVRVQEHQRLADLVEERLSLLGRQGSALFLHILLEIELQILENKVQLVLGEEDFLEPKRLLVTKALHLLNDIRVLEVLQKTDFPYCGRRDSIVLLFESNLLDGHEFASLQVLCLVHDAIGSLAEFLELLVLVESLNWLIESLRHDGIRPLLSSCVHFNGLL